MKVEVWKEAAAANKKLGYAAWTWERPGPLNSAMVQEQWVGTSILSL